MFCTSLVLRFISVHLADSVTAFFYAQETDDSVAFFKSQALGNRLTKIEDIAPFVRFLVTEGGWITGQTIFANGGLSTR